MGKLVTVTFLLIFTIFLIIIGTLRNVYFKQDVNITLEGYVSIEENIHSKSVAIINTRIILYWTGFYRAKTPFKTGYSGYISHCNLPCEGTSNRSRYKEASSIVFHTWEYNWNPVKDIPQVWHYFLIKIIFTVKVLPQDS